jgi:hypothetical protein
MCPSWRFRRPLAESASLNAGTWRWTCVWLARAAGAGGTTLVLACACGRETDGQPAGPLPTGGAHPSAFPLGRTSLANLLRTASGQSCCRGDGRCRRPAGLQTLSSVPGSTRDLACSCGRWLLAASAGRRRRPHSITVLQQPLWSASTTRPAPARSSRSSHRGPSPADPDLLRAFPAALSPRASRDVPPRGRPCDAHPTSRPELSRVLPSKTASPQTFVRLLREHCLTDACSGPRR